MSITTVEKPTFLLAEPVESIRRIREHKAAQHALAELLQTAASETSFSVLETLSQEAAHNPQLRPVLDGIIDSTAELLLEETTEKEASEHKYDVGLKDTWTAIRAWDIVRDEATAKLVVHVLDHFRAEGQEALAHAYMIARDSKKPFDVALDEYNQTKEAA